MVFLVLVLTQLVAVVAFLALYLDEGWPPGAVGRHVAYWTIAAGVVDLSWLLLILVGQRWTVWFLFIAQGAVSAVTWQRVWLVWRVRRRVGPAERVREKQQ